MRVEVDGLGAARRLGYADRVGQTGPRTVEVVRSAQNQARYLRPEKGFPQFPPHAHWQPAGCRGAGLADQTDCRARRRRSDLQHLRQSQPVKGHGGSTEANPHIKERSPRRTKKTAFVDRGSWWLIAIKCTGSWSTGELSRKKLLTVSTALLRFRPTRQKTEKIVNSSTHHPTPRTLSKGH